MAKISIFWFRRDLRLEDNSGLYHALKNNYPVLPLFIFDAAILEKLEDKNDARVEFIHKALFNIHSELIKHQSSIVIKRGKPVDLWEQIIKEFDIAEVYTNHDYEPYALKRDQEVETLLKRSGISFKSFKDQVIFEKNEILKDNGAPYTVYTPYSRKWKSTLNDFYLKSYPSEKLKNFYKTPPLPFPTLNDIGFQKSNLTFPPKPLEKNIILEYQEKRNYPALEGTSKKGVHLRFGTISIRKLASEARKLNDTFLNELIWREFFMSILFHFPYVEGQCFKREYGNIAWRNNEGEFKMWCEGNTGYPIVDAGMREMNATGFMHNRVRLVVASFLCKHLLIDWRWGEAYFARKLLDYELASNNGNWQWSAGCGCDAAPYFRIFNPYIQTEKFDKQLHYIKKWVPEFQEFSYSRPIVEHEYARKRAIEVYSAGLQRNTVSKL